MAVRSKGSEGKVDKTDKKEIRKREERNSLQEKGGLNHKKVFFTSFMASFLASSIRLPLSYDNTSAVHQGAMCVMRTGTLPNRMEADCDLSWYVLGYASLRTALAIEVD